MKIGTLAGVPKGKLGSCIGVASQSAASPIVDTDAPLSTRAVVFLELGGSAQPGESSLLDVFVLLTIRLSPAGAHRHTLVPAAAAVCVRACVLRDPLFWLGPLQFSETWSAVGLPQILQACGATKYHLLLDF